jgi:hypothetical protein
MNHIYCIIPLPLGLRYLLNVGDGHVFLLWEKYSGRQIEVTGIPEISIIDGNVQNTIRERIFGSFRIMNSFL